MEENKGKAGKALGQRSTGGSDSDRRMTRGDYCGIFQKRFVPMAATHLQKSAHIERIYRSRLSLLKAIEPIRRPVPFGFLAD